VNDWPDGVIPIRGLMSWCHLLVDESGVVLLDTGFPGDSARIRHRMEQLGFSARDLRAIVLTHGHIDHAGNAIWAQAWSDAPIYAHAADQRHLNGTYPYRGLARVCGALEMVARTVTRYQPPKINLPIAEGDELPLWGGLRVVHLPGHTEGHCGFYSAKRDVLFTGDLWVRFMMRTQVSPRIFTDLPRLVLPSLHKARAIGARSVIPGHYGFPSALRLKRRFENLCDEMERRDTIPIV
jgi:glyoxylase-like metal-dependent hydrolase (beta-lactamase superfamily II)